MLWFFLIFGAIPPQFASLARQLGSGRWRGGPRRDGSRHSRYWGRVLGRDRNRLSQQYRL